VGTIAGMSSVLDATPLAEGIFVVGGTSQPTPIGAVVLPEGPRAAAPLPGFHVSAVSTDALGRIWLAGDGVHRRSNDVWLEVWARRR
jgi:hypothetical protein